MKFFKTTPKHLDKRKLKRLKTQLNVRFRIVSGSNPLEKSSSINGITKNISPFGIGLEAGIVQIDHLHISHDSSMLTKNRLEVELILSPSDKGNNAETIHFVGEVVWYDKKSNKHQYPYEIGVEILKISQEETKKLESLISNN